MTEEQDEYTDDRIVDESDQDALPQRFLHPLPVTGTTILCGTGHHAMADRLGRDAPVVLDFTAGVEGRDDIDALNIDHTLHEQLSDRLAGLLQCGDEAAGEDAAEELVIEDQLIPAEGEYRDMPVDIDIAEHCGEGFGDDRRECGTENAPVEEEDEDPVEACIQYRRDTDEGHRRFRIPDCPQCTRHDVVLEGEEITEEEKPEIDGRIVHDIEWGMHGLEDRRCEQDAEQGGDAAGDRTEEDRGGERALQLLAFACTIELTHVDRRADAEARDALHQQHRYRIRDRYGAERCDTGSLTDEDGIDGVIGKLKEISENQWDGIGQKMAVDTAGGHISHSGSPLNTGHRVILARYGWRMLRMNGLY